MRKQSDRPGWCDFYLTAGLLAPKRMSLKKPDVQKEDFSAFQEI